jgi:hypothetical protein
MTASARTARSTDVPSRVVTPSSRTERLIPMRLVLRVERPPVVMAAAIAHPAVVAAVSSPVERLTQLRLAERVENPRLSIA